jgi:hypothetical protein
MIAYAASFKQNDLEHLLSAVPRYPISVKNLVSIASHKKMPSEVINFYSAFPDSIVFDDEDDMLARTEQVSLLRHEEEDQPSEDQVRGAED